MRTSSVVADMSHRRGYTLIEMVVVMTAAATIMGLVVGLLFLLMEFGEGSREQVAQGVALRQLAEQFRCDAHAAGELAAADEPGAKDSEAAWKLRLAEDHVIDYRVDEAELVRIERAGGKVVRTSGFSLPEDAVVSIETVEEAPRIVRLEIAPGGGPASRVGPHRFRVDAVLAKDRRFAETEPNEP